MHINFDTMAANRNPMVDEIIRSNKAKRAAPTVTTNADSSTLASFNGYYLLGDATSLSVFPAGAFLTVDTNIQVTKNTTTGQFDPVFDVQVILCLDGESSYTFDFSQSDTASFTSNGDGTYTLAFSTRADQEPLFRVDLKFTRTAQTDGNTASFSGTITTPDKTYPAVTGHTYNNPILPSLYSGAFYTHPLGQGPAAAHVLTIGKDFELLYTPLGETGAPADITSYSYNMNMYFFSFTDANNDETKLIMGTSAAGGLVCNDMTIIDKTAHPRTLTTIKIPDQTLPAKDGVELNQTNAKELADLSGYFPLTIQGSDADASAAHNGAFLSVEGQYVSSYLPINPPVIETKYKVSIGICLDGIHSTVFYFDTNCSFDADAHTLTIPATLPEIGAGNWVITFTPGYAAGTGSFSQFGDLSAASMIFEPSVTPAVPPAHAMSYAGKTPLGPVPLSAFAGPTLTSTTAGSNEALQILSDNTIQYMPPAISTAWQVNDQQQNWLEILYVPLMYIVVYQVRPADILDPDPGLVTCMLSLGTNGAHGLASINTRYLQLWPGIPPIPCPPTSVWALH